MASQRKWRTVVLEEGGHNASHMDMIPRVEGQLLFPLLRRALHLPGYPSCHGDHFPHSASLHSTRGGQCTIDPAVLPSGLSA